MSTPKLISPLLDNFIMGDPISEHDGVCCCPAINKETDEKYIVKIISVPASQVQLDALILSGAYSDSDAALSYFKVVTEGIKKEISTLNELADIEGFVPIDDCQIVPMDDRCGYDIYILSRYRNTLRHHLRKNAMSHLSALNLGLDLCSALAVARSRGYIYIGLKPANVFLTNSQEFRIGDIGFIDTASLPYASLPSRYLGDYIAPEITDAFSNLNDTLDIYSVGMILYEIFNGGHLPSKEAGYLAPPAYADSEMSEILLKACDPDPAKRWQTPVEFGQALVNYIQKNGAHDTPIVPIPTEEAVTISVSNEAEPTGRFEEQQEDSVAAPEIDANAEPATIDEITETPVDDEINIEEIVITEEEIFTEDNEGNLTLIEDSTVEDEGASIIADTIADTTYDAVSDEVSEILEQADDLIAHETPSPVIQPDPIEVTVPDIEPVAETEIPPENEVAASDENDATNDINTETETATADDVPSSNELNDESLSEETDVENDYNEEDREKDIKPSRKKRKRLVVILCAAITLCALAIGGLLFYKNYYLQEIENLVLLPGEGCSLSINVLTKVDESKLTVICTDAYGNQHKSNVVGKFAEFSDLRPNTAYNITVEVSGFHKLTGKTTLSYATPAQTEVTQFTAINGAEDGSVILDFMYEGSNSEKWSISYTTDGSTTQKVVFEGRSTTITGLEVGKEYTFTLNTDSGETVYGTNSVKFTPQAIVKAENVTITSYENNTISVQWTASNEIQVKNWKVHCFSSTFNQTFDTENCVLSIPVPDSESDYTIEITAEGMSVRSTPVIIPKNVATLSNVSVNETSDRKLQITWDATGYSPANGWTLQYSIDGSVVQQVTDIKENSITVDSLVPGSHYTFTLLAGENSFVINNIFEYTTKAAEKFSGFDVDSSKMEAKMCLTPDHTEWSKKYNQPNWNTILEDIKYTTDIHVGNNVSFLIYLDSSYETYDEDHETIETLFVIRDKAGALVNTSTIKNEWVNMWWRRYCGLDIPTMPQTPGEYTITIYFNGEFISSTAFTVAE